MQAAYPSQIRLCKGQVLLLPEWVALQNVLIIEQQKFGCVLAGSGPTCPPVPSSVFAPALASSLDVLS